jgi:hypothetical protein
MERAGIRKLKKVRIKTKPDVVYALRQYEQWAKRGPQELKAEIDRVSDAEKLSALEGGDDA